MAHQLLWVRLMVDALGAGAGTFARVTGAFFLGLSLGAWLASRLRPRRPWRAVAFAELAVGLLGLVVLWVSYHPALTRLPSGWAEAAQWILPFLLIVPPAFAMGLVLPWVLAGSRANGAQAAWLYAINTAGAVLGVLLVVGVALPQWGLLGAVLVTVGGNLLVACGCALMSNPAEAPSPAAFGENTLDGNRALIAFASGFLILGQEVVLQHQFAQVAVNSLFSSATVLLFVLAVLAAAAALAPIASRWVGPNALVWAAGLAALGAVIQPLLFIGMRGGLNYLRYELPAFEYFRELAVLGIVVVTPVMLFAGLIFPLLIASGGGRPALTGKLLAWNGLGGLCGAELTNLLLAPAFGLWQGMAVFACGYLALFALQGRRWVGAVLALLVIVGLMLGARLPQAGLRSGERLAALGTGREGVVGVIRKGADDWRILFNNAYTLGGSKAQFNQERQAHLPLLLHGHAQTAATLGVATGSTLAGAALHPGLQRIDAIELSPLAARYAREYFGPWNRDVFKDPRVHLIEGDARWVIARKSAEYDVIIGDLFLPWKTGEGRLFTREHFENVRRALKPNGLYCQWLPLFQLTRPQYEMILRTFREVFPDCFVIRGDFYRDQPIVGLVGGRSLEEIDWTTVAGECRLLEGSTKDALVTHPEGVAMLLLGRPPPLPPGPINTLADARLEWDAGRNIIGQREPWFVEDAFLAYESEFAPPLSGPLGQARAAGISIGQARTGKIEDLLPAALRDDLHAEWPQWPGRPKPYR